MNEVVSVKPIFAGMPAGLNAEAAKDADVVYQFNLSGEGGGQFAVTIKHGACTVEEGTAAVPNATISATVGDYLTIVSGAYPFGLAFINGRLAVEGDLRSVLRMGAYFAPTQEPSEKPLREALQQVRSPAIVRPGKSAPS